MVSISGYAIGELLFCIGLSYMLVFLCAFARLLRDLFFGEKIWRTLVVSGAVFLFVVIFYSTEIRIGTVMFINGFLSCFFIFELVNVMLVVYSKEEILDGSQEGESSA